MSAAKQTGQGAVDIIGQFGVGFYSAFMVAESIRVVSRSYHKEAQAAAWFSTGGDTYTIEEANREKRGTSVILKLREDAAEFLEEYRLREVIRKHSDFIPFPIYIEGKEEQVNRQTALWRQQPRQVEQKDYDEFYKQLTLDFEAPLLHAHMAVDAPVQMYALLYIPAGHERSMFSLRREEGLKLYSHKVLIQEYCRDLLPNYFRFVQGVVDSEDLPLNISRETVQSNKVMAQLKKLITSKVQDTLTKMATENSDQYGKFWEAFGQYIKEGVALEQESPKELHSLLRFHTITVSDQWSSLDDYVGRMKPDQKKIYYIMGDDERSIKYSPHLDLVRGYDYEVLALTEPIDAFMVVRLTEYKEFPLENVATADLKPLEKAGQDSGEASPGVADQDFTELLSRFKTQLGERVSDVRISDRLSDSPARLVDPEGAPNQEIQRVYRILKEDFQPPKKVLELNPSHEIVRGLNALPAEDELGKLIVEQVFEDALLVEGIHSDPVSMIPRLQQLMEAALKGKPGN